MAYIRYTVRIEQVSVRSSRRTGNWANTATSVIYYRANRPRLEEYRMLLQNICWHESRAEGNIWSGNRIFTKMKHSERDIIEYCDYLLTVARMHSLRVIQCDEIGFCETSRPKSRQTPQCFLYCSTC